MKKIAKAIKGLKELIKNPWLLNKVIDDDIVWHRYIKRKFDLHNGLPVLDINQISQNISETLECFAFLDGSCLPTDIALLKTLANGFERCKYFEIGTWRGESVVNVADVAAECYTLNLSKQALRSLGLDEKYIELQGIFSANKSNITHLFGDSIDFDFQGLSKKFDLIFIDGNHHYDYVKNDTEKVFKHLVHDNSIVVWHDYAYTPEKYRPEVFAAILDGTPAACREYVYHVSNTLCAVFINKKLPSNAFSPFVNPEKVFKVKIESKSR